MNGLSEIPSQVPVFSTPSSSVTIAYHTWGMMLLLLRSAEGCWGAAGAVRGLPAWRPPAARLLAVQVGGIVLSRRLVVFGAVAVEAVRVGRLLTPLQAWIVGGVPAALPGRRQRPFLVGVSVAGQQRREGRPHFSSLVSSVSGPRAHRSSHHHASSEPS